MIYGHCGSRKIEASLLNNGFKREDIVIAHPDHLDKVIGKKTKVLGITTHDPLGLGPASTTFSSLVGGEPYSSVFFRKLVNNPLLRKNQVKIIVGGPGTWQLDDKKIMKKYGINSIVIGEGEKVAPDLFEKAVNGDKIPDKVKGKVVQVEDIPLIKGPTINGLVEISRGCGRGCDFCTPTLLNLRHRPIEDIKNEVKLNIEQGNEGVLLHAEDSLRYGSNSMAPNKDKFMKLMNELSEYTRDIGFSHCSLASVASAPDLIEELSDFLNIGTDEKPWISPQIGLETGSVKLAKKHLRGKAKPFDVENWTDVVREAFNILDENDWVACTTLIMGLPGEEGDDVMETIELLDDLDDHKFFVVPLMFVPLGMSNKENFFSIEDMLPEHWQLLAKCIENDFNQASTLIKEISKMDGQGITRKYGFLILKYYMQRRMKPYLKDMREGRNPLQQ